jgi:hypothetical protein
MPRLKVTADVAGVHPKPTSECGSAMEYVDAEPFFDPR